MTESTSENWRSELAATAAGHSRRYDPPGGEGNSDDDRHRALLEHLEQLDAPALRRLVVQLVAENDVLLLDHDTSDEDRAREVVAYDHMTRAHDALLDRCRQQDAELQQLRAVAASQTDTSRKHEGNEQRLKLKDQCEMKMLLQLQRRLELLVSREKQWMPETKVHPALSHSIDELARLHPGTPIVEVAKADSSFDDCLDVMKRTVFVTFGSQVQNENFNAFAPPVWLVAKDFLVPLIRQYLRVIALLNAVLLTPASAR